jgi:drug/metabolite transporter (DMT)-like permease
VFTATRHHVHVSASVLLAILGAFVFALSAALQHSAARTAGLARPEKTIFGLLRGLVRNKRWLAGWIANVTGFGLHATALHLGTITVVQAVMVVQLLFALPFAVFRKRRWPLGRDWLGSVLVCAGLITLLSQGVPHGEMRHRLLGPAAIVGAGTVAGLIAASRLAVRHPQLRTALLSVAAGICFCGTAVLVTLATAELPHIGWALPSIAITTVTGGLLVQQAYASGSLPTAMTATTITDPVVSYIAGAVLFDVTANLDLGLLLVSGGLVAAGVVLLANSPTLHDEHDPVGPGAGGPSNGDSGDPGQREPTMAA